MVFREVSRPIPFPRLVPTLILLMVAQSSTVSAACQLRADSFCQMDTSTGHIDLSPLSNTDGTISFPNIPGVSGSSSVNVSFLYNPCSPFTPQIPVGTLLNECQDVLVCERYAERTPDNKTEVFYMSIGGIKNVACKNDSGGRFLSYEGIGISVDIRKTKVYLVCNKDEVGRLIPITQNITNSTDAFTFQLQSKHSCIIHPEPPRDAGGLSTGSILLIILFVSSALYLILGMTGRFCLVGARGLEVVPHLEFWRDLPDLVFDGFKFSRDIICERDHHSKYEDIWEIIGIFWRNHQLKETTWIAIVYQSF